MKKSIYFLFVLLTIGVITFSCNNDKANNESKEFKATFYTELTSIGRDSVNCTSPRTHLNRQEGKGSETTMGNFNAIITFCVDINTYEYGESDGKFIDENGDELYVEISGKVVPTNKEGYDLEYKNPFTITGGTGRYEGATGSGTTDSYINNMAQKTDHTWTGTIKLKKQ